MDLPPPDRARSRPAAGRRTARPLDPSSNGPVDRGADAADDGGVVDVGEPGEWYDATDLTGSASPTNAADPWDAADLGDPAETAESASVLLIARVLAGLAPRPGRAGTGAEIPAARTAERRTQKALGVLAAARGWLLDDVSGRPLALPAHTADAAYGVAVAVGIAAAVWLIGAAAVLGVWAFSAPAGAAVEAPLHFAGLLWLAAHHVPLADPDGVFGLTPLGFTLLPATGLFLTGRHAATRRPADPVAPFAALCGAALGYPAAALLVSWSAAAPGFHTDPAAAAVFPFLLVVVAFGLGMWRGQAALPETGGATAGWHSPLVVAAVRAAGGALGTLTAGGALLAAVALAGALPSAIAVGTSIGPSAAGAVGLFLIQTALLPNIVCWAVGVTVGPGFAVGVGSRIAVGPLALSTRPGGGPVLARFADPGARGGSPAGVIVHGPLPGLPLLQAVPHAGPVPWWGLVVYVAPLAAGVVAAQLALRSLRTAGVEGASSRYAAVGLGALFAAGAAGLMAAVSAGSVALGPEAHVGPQGGWIAAAVLLELVAVGASAVVADQAGGWAGALRAGWAARRGRGEEAQWAEAAQGAEWVEQTVRVVQEQRIEDATEKAGTGEEAEEDAETEDEGETGQKPGAEKKPKTGEKPEAGEQAETGEKVEAAEPQDDREPVVEPEESPKDPETGDADAATDAPQDDEQAEPEAETAADEPTAGEEESGSAGAALTLDDDGLGHHVGPGLPLGVPERPEEVEQAEDAADGQEDVVEQQPEQGGAGADRPSVKPAGEPDVEQALAAGLAGGPVEVGVVDGPGQADQGEDPEPDLSGA